MSQWITSNVRLDYLCFSIKGNQPAPCQDLTAEQISYLEFGPEFHQKGGFLEIFFFFTKLSSEPWLSYSLVLPPSDQGLGEFWRYFKVPFTYASDCNLGKMDTNDILPVNLITLFLRQWY